MHRFYDTVTEPIFEAIQPKSIVEIGSDYGPNTRKLLEFCQQHSAKLHVIDPVPKYDVAAWQEQYGEHLIFHGARSLDALPAIDRFDAVLIDGDHNWYTVFNELRMIEESCKESAEPFPLVMLHDIGWPYGRRDLYYDPETIPEEYRKPYEQRGIQLESEELAEKGGLNRNLANAISENDPQNGVLTAVEDFLKQTEQTIELVQLPGLHGLGILTPTQLKERNAKLAGFLEVLDLSPTITQYIELVEENRLEAQIAQQEQRARFNRLKDRLEKEKVQLEKDMARLKKANTQLKNEKTQVQRENRALRDKNGQLQQRALQLEGQNQHLGQQLQEIQNSRTWQLLTTLGRIRAKK